MIEINLRNIFNLNILILISSIEKLHAFNLRSLSINDCRIQSINKGIFNSIPSLKRLSLSRNEIATLGNVSFLYEYHLLNILELDLSENKLTKIQRGQFDGLSKIESIHIFKNLIEDIEVNAFSNMLKLKHLNLHSNRVKLIHNKIFFDKKNLETLHFYQNEIENIETIPFNTLYSLKILHLFSNKITSIKFGNFIHLVKLKELKLDKNEIGSFEANTFIGLDSLIYLDLSANKIRKIVNGAFDSLINVINLDLHLNDISRIEKTAFTDLQNLIYLNLDSNEISTLKNVRFNDKLFELSLRFNLISNLSEINSFSLNRLHISNNKIQTIDSIYWMPNLEHLDLSQNRLIKIGERSFSSLKMLNYLNLSRNKLDLTSEFNRISYFKIQTLLVNLDLSFNDIVYLDSNVTFQSMHSLKCLNLSNNRLKSIHPHAFGYLFNLTILRLGFNRISSLKFLIKLNNLEYIDLEHNMLSSIDEDDFRFTFNLVALNLNSNPIKSIHENAFERLNCLNSLKLSNTSLHTLFLSHDLKELDLSYLNFSMIGFMNLSNLEWISLAHTKTNISYSLFLSNLTRYVDFSLNLFQWDDFKMFDILGDALDTLILRQTNLQQLDQIDFRALTNLKRLDLSFNNLTHISSEAFETFVSNLEYLDLSSNLLYEFNLILNKLIYFNLENNRIEKIHNVMLDYFLIEIFKMANNRLKTYPTFAMSQSDSIGVDSFLEMYLNQNEITEIKYFSHLFGKLKRANFDFNSISLIQTDAFLNCRSLEYLSIANNRLTQLTQNNFHYLFSLVHLNLSSNEINYIENNSFSNLNKLKVLDLSYNKLLSIENKLFYGLVNLNLLSLISHNGLKIYNQSFLYLPNISTIYLNESLIYEYQCRFMQIHEKNVQRYIANKFIFYKSINLLAIDFSFNQSQNETPCDLVFRLFQFNVHLNLMTDNSNDLFYDICGTNLIKKENSYNRNYKRCFAHFHALGTDTNETKIDDYLHPILKVLSNAYFLLCISLLLIYLGPIFYMIFRGMNGEH
jgi:Leucine-rich repeat (LRR) protein